MEFGMTGDRLFGDPLTRSWVRNWVIHAVDVWRWCASRSLQLNADQGRFYVRLFLPYSPSAPDPPSRRTGGHHPTCTHYGYNAAWVLQRSPGRSTAVDAGATAESSELCGTSYLQSRTSGSRHASSTATALAANPSSRTVQAVYTDAWNSQSSVSGVLVWCRAVCRDHINTRRTPIAWNHKLCNCETTVQVQRACLEPTSRFQ